MASRCVVAYINKETGKVKGSYCHWDGYIDGVGAELQSNFTTYEGVKSLVDECPAYSSIAGEIEIMPDYEDFEHYEFNDLTEFEEFVDSGADGCDFAYIFMQREAPAEWFVYDTNFGKPSRQVRKLADEIARLADYGD